MISAPLYQWEFLRLKLIWAYQGPVLNEYRDSIVSGDSVALWHITKGQALLRWANHQLKIGENEWVLIAPGKIRQSFSKNSELWSVRFVMNSSANRCMLEGQEPVIVTIGKRLESSCSRLIKSISVFDNFGLKQMDLLTSKATLLEYLKLEMHFRSFVQDLLICLDQSGIQLNDLGEMDSRLKQCISEVQQSRLNRNYTECELAQFAGVSVSQVNRLFQEQFGQSSRAWLDDYRYTEAQRLLTGASPIKEVSYSLGFSSPQHFASWFRQRSDLSPSQWRKRQYV